MTDHSIAERYALLAQEKRRNLLRQLNPEEARELIGSWRFWARPKQLAPEGDWAVWMMRVGRGGGKLLPLTEQIPTPSGWVAMGDLRPGDTVFDERGRPCNVTYVSPTQYDRTYRLIFSDGAEMVAGACHQWITWTHRDRKNYLRSPQREDRFPESWWNWRLRDFGPEVRTTQEIVNTLNYNDRGDTNHCIPTCLPLQLPDANLPIPPYVLGYWLGNGTTASADVTCHQEDRDDVADRFESCGVRTSKRKCPKSLGILGYKETLRALGVLNNKHVPAVYLRASERQRLELLRGLMDSDGYHGGKGVEFCNTNKKLIDAVYELAISLGQKPTVGEGRAMLNGKDFGPKWRVLWCPTIQCFSLPRKMVPRDGLGQQLRNHHRMIVSAVEIDPVPMCCISVDSESSLYLASKAMIPTHNTRAGSGWVNERAREYPGRWIALVAATMADARDVMIEGPSGIIRTAPHDFQPVYEPSKRRITWPNGSWATVYSDEDPDQLRGFSGDTAWLDELGKYKHPRETWENLRFGMRESSTDRPRTLVTTTPRPDPIFKEIENKPSTVTVVGSSYENRANLDPTWFRETIEAYEGTRLGRQEIHAEILDDVPGALWTRRGIDESRVREAPALARVVVGVDPAITSGDSSNETGIVVSGVDKRGHGYVLEDASLKGTPDKWARMVVAMYRKWEADCVVAEANQGGEMVKHTLRTVDPNLPIKLVHATRGKYIRAEPIAALYEAGRVSHVGVLSKLEDQMISFTPELAAVRTSRDSPDRCFVAGTMIETEDGPVAIQLIRPGDMVWTRDGLRPVIVSELTNENAGTIEIELTNGNKLRGTPNHPVFTDRGWVDMGNLTCEDRLFHIGELEWPRESARNSTGSSILGIPKVLADHAGYTFMRGTIRRFTGMFGFPCMEKFLTDATSTILTETRRTIRLKTLLSLHHKNTGLLIGGALQVGTKSAIEDTWTTYAPSPKNGMRAKRVGNGIPNTGGMFTQTRRFLKRLAKNAGRAFWPNKVSPSFALALAETELMTGRSGIARIGNAKFVGGASGQGLIAHKEPVRVRAGERCSGAPVYNLRVMGANEYFANGILVHNCDALTWSLTSLFNSILTKRVEDDRDDYEFRKGVQYDGRNEVTGY